MTSHMRPLMPNSENNLKSRPSIHTVSKARFSNVEKTPKNFATSLKHMIYGFQNIKRGFSTANPFFEAELHI